ncbi:MAG: hypothetical protein EXS22_10235 [Pedosphaera sp.]|nr:hypothetical protein [Pedosphaera sp.]MSU44392.1 hypothetical protein [Pedosphaera sp.]
MRSFAVALLVSLGWLSHDWFLWDEALAPFGIPAGLAYHLFLTLAIAGAWAWAFQSLWPRAHDLWADSGSGGGDRHSQHRRGGRRRNR